MFRNFLNALKDIRPYIFNRANALPITGGIILTGVGMGLDFIAPYFFSEMVVTLISETATTTIVGIELTPMALMAASGAAAYGSKLVSNYARAIQEPIGWNAVAKLRSNYIDRILNQSSASEKKLQDKSRFDLQNTFRIYEIATAGCTQILPTFLRVVVSGTVLGQKSAEIGWGLCGAVVVYTGYNLTRNKKIAEMQKISYTLGDENYKDINRATSYTRLIQMYNNEKFEKERFEKSQDLAIKSCIKGDEIRNQAARGQESSGCQRKN
jgi:ABC-type multidrug transport system fused ATPase/permease subunit